MRFLYRYRSSVSVAHYPILHCITKHINKDRYCIRDEENDLICIQFVSAHKQPTDVLITGLNQRQFDGSFYLSWKSLFLNSVQLDQKQKEDC